MYHIAARAYALHVNITHYLESLKGPIHFYECLQLYDPAAARENTSSPIVGSSEVVYA